MVQCIKHLHHGIPLSDKVVCDQFLDDQTEFKISNRKKIDFTEVVVLESCHTLKIKEGYETGNYDSFLRIFAGQ